MDQLQWDSIIGTAATLILPSQRCKKTAFGPLNENAFRGPHTLRDVHVK